MSISIDETVKSTVSIDEKASNTSCYSAETSKEESILCSNSIRTTSSSIKGLGIASLQVILPDGTLFKTLVALGA